MASPPSTREQTKQTGQFTRATEGSRSLARGLLLLRAFRVGTSTLTNADLSARTGLPRPTVSRLTRSLVDAGFLSYDVGERAYRLAPIVLSLADAFRLAHQVTEVALPLMQEVAQAHQVNVGLALADQTDMVYLLSVRHSADSVSRLRRVAPGTRVPIHETAVGLAYLAALPADARRALVEKVAQEKGSPRLARQLESAIAQVQRRGYSQAAFMQGNMAVGRTFQAADRQLYALNISFEARAGRESLDCEHYAQVLHDLCIAAAQALNGGRS